MPFRAHIRILAFLIWLATCLVTTARGQNLESFKLKEICSVSFAATTQAGPMKGVLGVCRLESDKDSDISLCIVALYEREYGARILKVLELAHSPVMEQTGDKIAILYTSGANTTCVTTFSISSGVPRFVSTETIRWNDYGNWRTSDTFARYVHLLETREKPDPIPSLVQKKL